MPCSEDMPTFPWPFAHEEEEAFFLFFIFVPSSLGRNCLTPFFMPCLAFMYLYFLVPTLKPEQAGGDLGRQTPHTLGPRKPGRHYQTLFQGREVEHPLVPLGRTSDETCVCGIWEGRKEFACLGLPVPACLPYICLEEPDTLCGGGAGNFSAMPSSYYLGETSPGRWAWLSLPCLIFLTEFIWEYGHAWSGSLLA